VRVLDKGIVELKNFMGGDLAVVAAARVSNGVSYEEASRGAEKDQKLINYLTKHKHGTPFEHSVFQFYIKAPIFIAREMMRHRVSSFNEISGRYVQYEPEFYIPEQFRIPAESNKQGSIFPSDEWKRQFDWLCRRDVEDICSDAYETYKDLLRRGVAKEMARMVLPLNLYTQYYWTVNARSLMNFLTLRCAEDAQWEIRQFAFVVRDIFKEKMPMTFNAWNDDD